jgi:argininosuccinate lyase
MPHKKPMEAKKHVKSWHGRLSAEADSATAALLASLDVDTALWKYDIAGSLAHAQMLREEGLLTAGDFAKIKKGLHAVEKDIAAGRISMPIELEDIHMVIEADLVRRVGDAGRKLHTGRSRNDQIALDLRLWARDVVEDLSAGIAKLQTSFIALAERQGGVVFPAYTHLQRAQPIVLGHALLAYVEMLQRDAERLADARKRVNVCPLGSGAVAGTSLPLNRQRTAELLGFPQFSRNSIDAVSDRDFLAELCFACSMLAVHLSRWAEDWIIYSSGEFNLLELHDAFCTSSSMMPQKKNADTLELIRGKSAGVLAQLVGMMTLVKGLPLAYNRDLQDDKRFAFEAVGMMKQTLAVAPGIVDTVTINQPDLSGGFLDATSLAEYLVEKSVPFRTAHGIVGKIVAQAEKQGLSLAEMPLAAMQKHSRKIQSDVGRYLGAKNVVKRYAPDGAAGAKQLAAQLRHWKRLLG